MVSCASVFERKKGKLRGGESNPGLDGVVNCNCVDNVVFWQLHENRSLNYRGWRKMMM
jgi:hypothetical protein